MCIAQEDVLIYKGLISRQYKPVYWSPSSGTALAEAELEYDDNYVSRAVYVKFELIQRPAVLTSLDKNRPLYALIWTTTPWTLPANKAIAVHPQLLYSVIAWRNEYLVMGTSRMSEVLAAAEVPEGEWSCVLEDIKGEELVKMAEYRNPLHNKDAESYNLITADYVNSESGTGLVHAAPGHGFDDFEVCKKYSLDALAPVDDAGLFTKDALPGRPHLLDGKAVLNEGTEAIIELIKDTRTTSGTSSLWATHKYTHKYPIDWRTKLPVIIRATAQWFANIDDVKDIALNSLENVTFIPEGGKSRLRSFVTSRNSWCISRQRAWGVPIPALYRLSNGSTEAVLSSESISHIIKVISERGTDAWWSDPEDDQTWISSSLPNGKYTRGKDTMDVWFDSGTTWTQLPRPSEPSSPIADVYFEGSDQHRGWFQSSLLTRISCLAEPTAMSATCAPFKTLITHGFILDEKGRKMSKSIGNVVTPDQIMNGTLVPPLKPKKRGKSSPESTRLAHDAMGLDALRLWVAKTDYTNDVPVGEQVLQGVHGSLHKFRVTLKWLLGILHDYDTSAANLADTLRQRLDLSDRLALRHLTQTAQNIHSAYVSFEPYKAMRELERYIVVDLSSFYFETAKDVIYTSTTQDKLRAQYVCNEILQTLLTVLAPVTPLLVAESLYYASPSLITVMKRQGRHSFERDWVPDPIYDNNGGHGLELGSQHEVFDSIRREVNIAQEDMRTRKVIGSSLETAVELRQTHRRPAPVSLQAIFDADELARALVVSEVTFTTGTSGDVVERLESDPAKDSIIREIELDKTQHRQLYEVRVGRVSKGKCPRCWRYVIPKSDQENHTERGETDQHVCKRCQTALLEKGEARESNAAD